eukprot:scaffold23959_cov59-Cyclotella_meneghiniana.AAC.5
MDDLGEAGTNWTVANINKPRESAGGGGVSQPGTQDNTCTKPSPSSTVPYYGTLPTHGTAQRESVQCSITDVLYWLSFYHLATSQSSRDYPIQVESGPRCMNILAVGASVTVGSP